MSETLFPRGRDGLRYFWLSHSVNCPARTENSLLAICDCDVHERHGPKHSDVESILANDPTNRRDAHG